MSNEANQGYLPYPKGFATAAIHHDQEPEKWDSMAVVNPLVTSTTYKQYGPADFKVFYQQKMHFQTLNFNMFNRNMNTVDLETQREMS